MRALGLSSATEPRRKPSTGARCKTTFCSWRYKKYPRLHDVVLKVALVDKRSQSMIIDLTLLGVSSESAIAFCKKFMGALRWLDS